MNANPINIKQLSAITLSAFLLAACQSGSSSNSNGSGAGSSAGTTSVFTKSTTVFGVKILATKGVSDAKLTHASNVMAAYLDNDQNGVADNQAVADKLVENKATLVFFANEAEVEAFTGFDQLNSQFVQDLYASETHPGGAAKGVFDASLEEVLHLITHAGFAQVYPGVFGESTGSVLASAMDTARGGQFQTIPQSYPQGAWYTYDDATCDYSCMATEYIYWALTSILGAQDFSGRQQEIQQEWKLNTSAKVQATDTAIYNLLTDSQYALPSVLPTGSYGYKSFEITAP